MLTTFVLHRSSILPCIGCANSGTALVFTSLTYLPNNSSGNKRTGFSVTKFLVDSLVCNYAHKVRRTNTISNSTARASYQKTQACLGVCWWPSHPFWLPLISPGNPWEADPPSSLSTPECLPTSATLLHTHRMLFLGWPGDGLCRCGTMACLLQPERSAGGRSLQYTEDDKVKRIPGNEAGATNLRKRTQPPGLCSHNQVTFLNEWE